MKAFVFICFFALATRLFYVQAVIKTDLKTRADRQNPTYVDNQPVRFRIFDRDSQTLAETVQVDSCYVDPKMLEKPDDAAHFLSGLLGMDKNHLSKIFKTAKTSFLWVKRDISPQAVLQIRDKKWPGLGIKKEWRRHYPLGPLASHLLGFVGVDGKGLSGVEHHYNRMLTPASEDEPSDKNAIHGDVQLTISANVQQIAERELEWGISLTKAKRGMVIIQAPQTGEVLGMAAWPPLSLDPEKPPHPTDLRIPPLMDVFEPGSTYKLVTMTAALEENKVSLTEKFSGENGAWDVMDVTIHDHEPQGMMTIQDILTRSSNIGCAKIGERLGSTILYQYSRLYGFGVFPGSDVSGEAKGVLRPVVKWSGVSKYVVSFGQEVGVTALQIVNAYSAVANGGELMEPRFVKGILNAKGEALDVHAPARIRRVFSPATGSLLTKMLMNVVLNGTGQQAQLQFNPDVKVAGKTGTAQKFDLKTHRYHSDLTLLSFCGFFPAQAPRYTILVILDEPEGRRWGGTDAAPIFRRIAEQLMPKAVS